MGKPRIKQLPSTTELLELFHYDESSPSCLIWKKKPKYGPTKVGDVAGGLNNRGYWSISISSKNYLVHRVIYKMFNFEFSDDYVIDHINGITSDNRLVNLRLVPLTVNMRNQKMYRNNTSGVTGVKYFEDTRSDGSKLQYYVAQINTTTAKRKSKSFSWLTYGKDIAFLLAVEWRKNQLEEMSSSDNCYSERHGKQIENS